MIKNKGYFFLGCVISIIGIISLVVFLPSLIGSLSEGLDYTLLLLAPLVIWAVILGIYYVYVGFREDEPDILMKFSLIANSIALVVFLVGYFLGRVVELVNPAFDSSIFSNLFIVSAIMVVSLVAVGFIFIVIEWFS